jgi:hypothetical protein
MPWSFPHPAPCRLGRAPRRTDRSFRCFPSYAHLPRWPLCYGRLDDALAPKHEAAPLFKAVALLLAAGSVAGSPWPPLLDIFRCPPPKPPSHSGTLPSIHLTPLARVSSRPRCPFAGAPALAATTAGRRRAPSPAPCTPNQAHQLVAGESLVILPTFPGRPRHRSHRILAGTAAPMA